MPSFDLPTLSEKQTATGSATVTTPSSPRAGGEWLLCWTTFHGEPRQASITKQPIKIGNSARCEIQLDSSEAKPLHVVISQSEQSVIARNWVEETLHNEQSFTTTDLKEDDKLTVAGQEFTISFEETRDQSKESTEDTEFDIEQCAQSDSSIDYESKLRDRIALNYQRIKRLVGTLRLERRDGGDACSRVSDLEQSLQALTTELESISEENESLRTTSVELEKALLEAHEYLTSIKEQEFVSETSEIEEDLLHDTTYTEPVVESPDETQISSEEEIPFGESVTNDHMLLADSIEEEASCSSIEDDNWSSENDYQALETPTSFDDVAIPTHEVEGAPTELTDDAVDLDTSEKTTAENDFAQSTWEVEESCPEPAETTNELHDSQLDLPTEDDRIDDLFGSHQEVDGENSEPFEPTSFIDKYAPLEESEASESRSEESYEDSFITEQASPLQESLSPSPEDHESEESMDDYLQKMMARISGAETGNEQPTGTINKTDQSVATQPESPTLDSSEDEELPKFQDLSELCKSLAPEADTDMHSLRSLANDSARKAIQTAQANQWRANIVRRFGAVGIGLIGSIVGLVTAPSLVSPQAILCFCLIAAWGYAGLRAVVSSQSNATLDIDFKAHLSKTQEAEA